MTIFFTIKLKHLSIPLHFLFSYATIPFVATIQLYWENVMNKDDFDRVYCAQYKILEDKLIELSEYITIHPSNFATFSLQLNSLFILVCSEIDSVAGEFCKVIKENEKSIFGIINKIDIIVENNPNLRNICVSTKYPYEKINLVPFQKFALNSPSWWSDYNDVKHNRAEQEDNGRYNYQKANLKNVLFSFAALYLLLTKLSEELDLKKSSLESRLFESPIK